MKKVLILGVSAVQYDAIKVLNELGYETYAIAREKDGPGYKIAQHFEQIDFSKIDEVIDYVKENKIDLVYSFGSDIAIPISCKISERLKLPSFVNLETALNCNKKDRMRETLGGDFEGNVPFQVMENIKEASIPFPIIVKPTDSQGQRGLHLVKDQEELEKIFERVKKHSRQKKVIVEKYIGGTELSCNCYMINGKMSFIFISDRVTWPNYIGLINKHIVPSERVSKESYKKIRDILEKACVSVK